jgi:NAD(P)-dependent dehydrogenase (short-subunit alcohol dehydrogenase family)
MRTPVPLSVSRQVRGRLAGETAIVTGSTSGVGRATAETFAAAGAAVVVTGRDAARGTAVVEGILQAGGTATFVAADLLTEPGRAQLVRDAIDRYGALTILVNNASGRRENAAHLGARLADIPADAWDDLIVMNLTVPAALCRLTIPHMLEAGHGSIVNISSRTADRVTPGTAAYTAAKAGLNALGRAITADYARDGIRCNAVQPGHIEHAERNADVTEEVRAEWRAQHLTRLTTAEDVAYAVLFLASVEAATITGVVMPVDGGSTAVRGTKLG